MKFFGVKKKIIGIVTAVCVAAAMMMPATGIYSFAQDCEAKIGAAGYERLEEAIEAVESGETITLQENIERAVTIDKAGISFTLNLNNKTITKPAEATEPTEATESEEPVGPAEPSETNVENNGALNIVQGTLTLKNGEIINSAGTAEASMPAIHIAAGAALNFGDVKIIAYEGSKAIDREDTTATAAALPKQIVEPEDWDTSETAPYEITATQGYQATVTAGTGGTITPGSNLVKKGTTVLYTIQAKTGYRISNITTQRDGAAEKSTDFPPDKYKTTPTEKTRTFYKVAEAHTIKATFVKKKYKLAASVNTTAGGSITGSATITHGSSKTFYIKVNRGFKLNRVLVDGKSVGKVSSYTFSKITKAHTIKAEFEKTGTFIMIDAGHYDYYNRSNVVKSYWESKMTWKLQNYLVTELENYPGIVTETTRTNQAKDLDLFTRGYKSKGYDLFLSLHSNWSSSQSTDYPLVIIQSCTNNESALASKLGSTIRTTMGTKQPYTIWKKRESSGDEWYGVLRGARAAGTPGFILEHSFHSNKKMTNWLLSNTNLNKLAKAEAKTIAAYYGKTLSGAATKPRTPGSAKAASTGYSSVRVSWDKSAGAAGYVVYRASSKYGTYSAVKTIKSKYTETYKNWGLKTGKTYYYKIRAYRWANDKKVFSSYSKIVYAKPIPWKPTFYLYAGKGKITVKWSGVDGATGYMIYRASSKYGTYKKIKTITNNKTFKYTSSGLIKGKKYYYKMRAYRKVDGTAVYGNLSSIKAITTKR